METADAVGVLGALAQETRLTVFRYLVEQGLEGAAAGRVAADLGLHAATLSFHLAALRQAGLVTSRRDSRSIVYSADFATVNDLVGFLLQNCCRGRAPGGADERSAA
ncbi:MAG: ArsR/SmtB family transcription factor [Pseudomonadota bacterium]